MRSAEVRRGGGTEGAAAALLQSRRGGEAVRMQSLEALAQAIAKTGECIRSVYPLVAHTSDLLVLIGKFAPSKDKKKGKCPGPLVRVTTTCRGAGSALTSLAHCINGAYGLCDAISSGIRCVNHADGLRAGLDHASRPEIVLITTLPQLEKVLRRWDTTGAPTLLDVGPDVTIAFAYQIFRHLGRLGEAQQDLIRDGPNMCLRLAQRARLMNLLREHPLPSAVNAMLSTQEQEQGEAAGTRQQYPVPGNHNNNRVLHRRQVSAAAASVPPPPAATARAPPPAAAAAQVPPPPPAAAQE